MLLSRKYDFIFLKTRKTAGTSVEMLLEPLCTPPGHVVQEVTEAVVSPSGIVGARLVAPAPTRRTWYGKRLPVWRNHMTAKAIRDALGRRTWDRCVKISTVRNPFDRAVSQFHWNTRREGPRHPAEAVDRFRDWVRGRWPDDFDVTHLRARYVIDRAIRFERLREDIEALAADLGLPVDLSSLPHAKSLGHARKGIAVADYYDAESVEIVRRRMRWVFDNHDYPETPAGYAA